MALPFWLLVLADSQWPGPHPDLKIDVKDTFAQCSWKTRTDLKAITTYCSPRKWNFGGDWPGVVANRDQFFGGPGCKNSTRTIPHVQTCSRTNASGTWHAVKVGPFFSGGGDWNQVDVADVFPPLALSAYYIGMVDADGTPYGYPPFHAHHAYMHSGDSVETGDRDSPIALSDGASLCPGPDPIGFGNSLPVGYCIESYDPIFIDAMFNDVRVAGSEPLRPFLCVPEIELMPDMQHAPSLSSQIADIIAVCCITGQVRFGLRAVAKAPIE